MSRFARIVFLLLCLKAGISDAQTYVRPSDGSTVTVNTAVPLVGPGVIGPLVTSSTYNMTGFSGMTIVLKTDKNNCKYLPLVFVRESPASTFIPSSSSPWAPAINSFYVSRRGNQTSDFSDYYTVAPLTAYVRLDMGGIQNPQVVAPGNDCTMTVQFVPLAFAQTVISVSPDGAVTPLVTNTVTELVTGVVENKRFIRLQNVGTENAYCNSIPLVSTTQYGFVLRKGTVDDDGTGGVVELPNLATKIFCVTAGPLLVTRVASFAY